MTSRGLFIPSRHVQQLLTRPFSEQNIYWQMGNIKQQADWIKNIEDCPPGEKVEITGPTLEEAESEIREWLTALNDICRIASFFHVRTE